jgi:hypothetical protein
MSTEVLGPNEMGGVKRPRNLSDDNLDGLDYMTKERKDKKQKKDKKEKKEKDSKKKSTKDSEDAVVDESELTLAQRLERISKRLDENQTTRNDEDEKADTGNIAPTADSLVTLLEQALQSSDASLLEQCLACSDVDIIDATMRKLPTQRVLVLLKLLVAKFEKKPSRGVLMTHWLSCIHQLAALSQILEQRIHSFSKLASLAGRLDLLMSQVIKQKSEQSNGFEPLVTFEF